MPPQPPHSPEHLRRCPPPLLLDTAPTLRPKTSPQQSSAYDEIDDLIRLVLCLYEKRTVNGDTPEVAELARKMVSFGARQSLEDEIREVIREHVPMKSSQRMTVEDANSIIRYFLSLRSGRQFDNSDDMELIHPDIIRVAAPRIKAGQYADAVEAAFKEINNRVKKTVRHLLDVELDGTQLMQQVFSPGRPLLLVADNLETKSNKDTQQGYMMMFSGAMSAIRNPKAHENMVISREDALRKLYFASLLMFKLDAAKLAHPQRPPSQPRTH